MKPVEIILLSIGLAMDAFSVSVCEGLRKINLRCAVMSALSFGIFQASMPLIGYVLGSQFASYINSFSPVVSFILLGIIGTKMIYESFHGEENKTAGQKFNFGRLIILSIATSIDALAVGIVFAAENVDNISFCIMMIGVITAVISFMGVLIGKKFGSRYETKAEIIGGVVLILIGLKLLLEWCYS
jgi:putative Mn2+ efflux pump MntP